MSTSYPQLNSLTKITLSSNITLSWNTDFQSTNPLVSDIIEVTPTGAGYSITLPDATNISVGLSFQINNLSAYEFTLLMSGGNTLSTLAAQSFTEFYLSSNLTAAGEWRQVLPSGTTGITSVSANADASDGNLTILGSPITTVGTLSFGLGNDLLALSSFINLSGISVRTAANSWTLRSISGSANQIDVSNGSGVAGNPVISLSNVISGISSITCGNINVALNAITATNINGGLALNSLGTGDVVLNPGNIAVVASGLARVRSLADIIVENGKTLFLQDSATTSKIGLNALNLTAGDYTLTLPPIAPVAGQVLYAFTSTQLAWGAAGMLQLTGTLSAAQILALNTTPVLVIPAAGAGRNIVVHNFCIVYTFNTVAFTGGGDLYLQYGNGVAGTTLCTNDMDPAVITSTTNAISYSAGDRDPALTVGFTNTPIYIWNDTAVFAGGGDGTAQVSVWYSIL